MTFQRIAIIASGICGAAGVALSAIAAHRDSTGQSATAAQMLLFHAPALLAFATLAPDRLRPWAFLLLVSGVSLFATDLSVRGLLGWDRLFAMAAPAGGMMMIAGWLLLAISALLPAGKSK